MRQRYVTIGSGPAAVSAAETIRAQDPNGEIVIVGAEPHGYYSRPGLAYYLAGEVPENRLFPFRPEDFARLNCQLILGRATGIDAAGHRVTLDDGRILSYDRLLLATGARAIPVQVPGAELEGVVKLDDLMDARGMIQRSRRAKAAVVVGGGITALEIVEGLRARGVHVHYFMRQDRYWSNVLSEEESGLVERGLESRGVQIHPFTELAEILGQDGHVRAVVTANGEAMAAQMVAVAIGVLPHKDLAEAAVLACRRGVVVDEYLRSTDEDIFAAGDAAEVYEPLADRHTVEVLWSSALAKGRTAGLNMTGRPTHKYEKAVPLNVTRLAGLKITIMGTVGSGKDADLAGIARGDSETWRRLGEASSVERWAGDSHIRLAIGEKSISGAVVVGDQTPTLTLQRLIEARADISGFRTEFLEAGESLTDVIENVWGRSSPSHSR